MTRKIISIICIIAIIAASGFFCYEYIYLNNKDNEKYANLSDSLLNDTDYNKSEIERQKEEYKKKYPNINFPEGMLLKYYPAFIKNQDVRGWISIPDLKIDYPIVQSSDNVYYLTHDIDKKYYAWGVPFFDSSTVFNPDSHNLVVYSHNSKYQKTKMFAPLDAYLKIDGYKKTPVIKCDTIYEENLWKVYAVFISNADSKDDNGYCFNYMITDCSDKVYDEYIKEVDKRAIYKTGIDINANDSLLTLSTCNYSFKNARLVVICRKIRPGESTDVDTTQALYNKSPRYPQAWYNAKKIDNPYKNDYN